MVFFSILYDFNVACIALGGSDNFENLQVSSRTDRGVHALWNTCHVDLRKKRASPESSTASDNRYLIRNREEAEQNSDEWDTQNILHGLNHHLRRMAPCLNSWSSSSRSSLTCAIGYRGGYDISVLAVTMAPPVFSYNVAKFSRPAPPPSGYGREMEPLTNSEMNRTIATEYSDWHARFTASKRTYMYRLLAAPVDDECLASFEWDRTWRVRGVLDVPAMKEAAVHFIGTHDFTSFRGRGCRRLSPVVTVQRVDIAKANYREMQLLPICDNDVDSRWTKINIVTITVTGSSFLYRQVRNIVGCLEKVGHGLISPMRAKEILNSRDRRVAPAMAPAHGLFLVDVEHEGVSFRRPQ